MGQKLLVEKQVSDGERLVEALDAGGVKVRGALWLYDSEIDSWELRILLRDFDPRADPRIFYRSVSDVFRAVQPSPSFDVADIRIVEADDPVMRALRESVLAAAANVSRAHLGGNRMGGVFIDEAYLYRIG